MPDATLITVANAIASEINEGVEDDEFSIDTTFEAEVIWGDRTVELPKAGVLAVSVVPVNWTLVLDADSSWVERCRYQIGVRQRFEPAEFDHDKGRPADAGIKDLVTLLYELVNFFAAKMPNQNGRKLTDVQNALWKPDDADEPAIDVMIDWESLEENHQFLGWFELTYEVDS